MIQRSSSRRFLVKAGHAIAMQVKSAGKNFQSHFAMQPGVFRQVDFAHAARAQRADDFVGTKSRAFSDGHRACCWGMLSGL